VVEKNRYLIKEIGLRGDSFNIIVGLLACRARYLKHSSMSWSMMDRRVGGCIIHKKEVAYATAERRS